MRRQNEAWNSCGSFLRIAWWLRESRGADGTRSGQAGAIPRAAAAGQQNQRWAVLRDVHRAAPVRTPDAIEPPAGAIASARQEIPQGSPRTGSASIDEEFTYMPDVMEIGH